jgi:hypothetical protein
MTLATVYITCVLAYGKLGAHILGMRFVKNII